MVSIPFPLLQARGDFLQYLPWELGWAPRSKFHNIVRCPTLAAELYNFQICPHSASSNSLVKVQISLPGTGSLSSIHLFESLFRGTSSPSWLACLSNLGGSYFPSHGSKKSFGNVNQFSFLLIMIEWQLPTSLHADLNSGNFGICLWKRSADILGLYLNK